MGTPPSAKGVTAQLPFVDEQFEGADHTSDLLQTSDKPLHYTINCTGVQMNGASLSSTRPCYALVDMSSGSNVAHIWQ